MKKINRIIRLVLFIITLPLIIIEIPFYIIRWILTEEELPIFPISICILFNLNE